VLINAYDTGGPPCAQKKIDIPNPARSFRFPVLLPSPSDLSHCDVLLAML
jgi:hypothetical protein